MSRALQAYAAGLVAGVVLPLAACRPAGSTPPGGPATPPAGAAAAEAVFQLAGADVGLDFTHDSGAAGDTTILEIMGPGAALFDYDGDGDLDAYLVQGHRLPRAAGGADPVRPPPDGPTDRLFRNDLALRADGGRSLHFTDVTDAAGIRAPGYGMGVATGDYNNDGHIDLYVTNWGPNQLWRNNGDGTFGDVTAAAGADDARWSTSAAFVDYDRDGWLDLVLVNYVAFTLPRHHPCLYQASNQLDYCGPFSYPAEPARLLHNRGDGTFDDVTLAAGLASEYGPGLGVVAADVNEDGWPDIYVANDSFENQLWINVEGRRFANEARLRGAAVNRDGMPEAGMGVVASDLNGDGHDDLFITHQRRETNTLYGSLSAGLFRDDSLSSGLGPPSWPLTGFGVADIDYDNDGLLDLAIVNGDVHIIQEQMAADDLLPLKQAGQLFHQRAPGRFEDVSAAAGTGLTTPAVGRGLAWGDIDNDGDSDLLVANNHGPARLLINTVGAGRSWVGLRVVGGEPARDQLGARVEVIDADGAPRVRRAHTDGSYLSAGDPRVLVGLGDQSGPVAVRVRWPDGSAETWSDIAPRRYHSLARGRGAPGGGP